MSRIVKNPDERRQEILAAARELFSTKSYAKTTMRDVMEKLGIAKGTIYHYFKSKEDLLEAVVENIVEEEIARQEILLEDVSGNGLDKLRILITSSNLEDQHEDILESLHQPGNMGMHTRQLAVMILKLSPLYGRLIQQGCEEGIFQTDHPLEAAEFILSGVQFLTDMGIYPWTQEDLIRRAVALPALVEAQLKAPSGSFNFLIE